jgi:hypothetical protein
VDYHGHHLSGCGMTSVVPLAGRIALSNDVCPDEPSRLGAIAALYQANAERSYIVAQGFLNTAFLVLRSSMRKPVDWE